MYQRSSEFARSCKRFLLINSILVFNIIASVKAEDLSVVPGEYVVTQRTSRLSSVLKGDAFIVKDNIGHRSFVVRDIAKPLALTSNAIVKTAYDPAQNKCDEWIKNNLVDECSPNYIVHAYNIPNDPNLSSTWGLDADNGMDAVSAWDLSTGSADQVVAVIDTGIDYNHEDLKDNVWINPYEIPGNGIDDDKNGYVDDIHGINANTGSGDPMDDNGHGTHVSGTIGGIGNNGIGVSGVNWHVKIMGLKFLDGSGSGSLAGAVDALHYLSDMKRKGINIKVSNNSWGGSGYSQVLESAIAEARDAGIIFVAAAGNESNDNDLNPSYPASFELDNVVSVAAIDRHGNIANFSNYGISAVDIAAPGVDIMSSIPGNGYAAYSGTSMATPHVTGALALLNSFDPSLSIQQLIARLYESGIEKSSVYGSVRTGRIANVGRMLRNETVPVSSTIPEDPCQYSSTVANMTGNLPAPSGEPLLLADETNYTTVKLPFEFPFFSQKISKVVVSPNGVLYFNSAPEGYDYEAKARPPENSFAAFHTDILPDQSPFGVWVFKDRNKVTFLWYGRHYSLKEYGWLKVWTVLHSSGQIDNYISFSDDVVRSAAIEKSTIGIRSVAPYSSTNFFIATQPQSNNFGMSFVSQCHNNPVAVNNLKVTGTYQNKKSNSIATSRKPINIQLSTSGQGEVPIKAKFNNQTCPDTLILTVNSDAKSTIRGKLPAVPAGINNIQFIVTSHRKRLSIMGSNAFRNKKSYRLTRTKKLSASRLDTLCENLFKSFE